jgi:RNA polymerase sigma-70 factor (ECF subfamily)
MTFSVDFEQHNEEALAQLAQQGSQAAFSALYERLFDNVYRRVRYSIPERDVEDVTQEVFIAAMRSLKNYRGEAKFRTWLRTLVARQIADYYRHRKSVEADIEIGEEYESGEDMLRSRQIEAPMMEYAGLDDQIILRQCLKRLPDHYREVIVLRIVEGLPFNEISEIQKMTLEATKSQFRRAIAALQKLLGETGHER